MHVIIDGTTVVDLVGGWRDGDRRLPWQPDTLVDFYSVGKAFLALLALQLVDSGLIALDDPVATAWPEFAAGGKEGVSLRQALCHRAAVPAIREHLTNEDLWDWTRDDRRAGRDGAVVGTRHTARLPHQHLRAPDRRGGPTGERGGLRAQAGRSGGCPRSRCARRRPADGAASLPRR